MKIVSVGIRNVKDFLRAIGKFFGKEVQQENAGKTRAEEQPKVTGRQLSKRTVTTAPAPAKAKPPAEPKPKKFDETTAEMIARLKVEDAATGKEIITNKPKVKDVLKREETSTMGENLAEPKPRKVEKPKVQGENTLGPDVSTKTESQRVATTVSQTTSTSAPSEKDDMQRTELPQAEIDALQKKYNPTPRTPRVYYDADSLHFNTKGEIIDLMKDEATHLTVEETYNLRDKT